MEWLKDVAKDHKEWVKLVKSFGEDFFAEDIVQESGFINKGYSKRNYNKF